MRHNSLHTLTEDRINAEMTIYCADDIYLHIHIVEMIKLLLARIVIR